MDVVFTNHTAEHLPGELATVSDDEAERLINAHMARKATAKDRREDEEATVEDEPAAKKK